MALDPAAASPQHASPGNAANGPLGMGAGKASPDPREQDLSRRVLEGAGWSAAAIAAHLDLAHRLGSDAIDLALGAGALDEAAFHRALARLAAVEVLDDVPFLGGAAKADEIFALRGARFQRPAGQMMRLVAPNGPLARLILRQAQPGIPAPFGLVTRQALLAGLLHRDREMIAHRAVTSLPASFSAAPSGQSFDSFGKGMPLFALGIAGLAVLGLMAAAILAPLGLAIMLPLLLTPIFLTGMVAVLTATIMSAERQPRPPKVPEAELPRYTVLVPLFREGGIVPDLVRRLDALSYPRDRIEAFLLVEEEDLETRQALAAMDLPNWFLVFLVPDGQPRTKPRALNAALPFASGDLLVVFDAEDEPEPNQLLRAAAHFRAAPADVACLQGRLAISNALDGFLTRRFAIDYTTLFDCVKAGVARSGWPVALGGSSNHFRTGILRQVGGWDAWNVTEDADLGMRLARFGWKVGDLPSTTWEEAPNTLPAWMNQRTRWMKGWLQTVLVHLREPATSFRQLGAFHAAVTTSMAASVLVGALSLPFISAGMGWRIAFGGPFADGPALSRVADLMMVFLLVSAALAEIIPALVALRRRRALWLSGYVLLAPITHILLSVAAWRAVWEWFRRPHYWHKTTHGLARNTGGLAALPERSET